MNSKTVSMAAIGFSDNELRILRTVSSLSRSGRAYHYELTTNAPQRELAVFICNADNPEALARWNIYRVAFPDAVVLMASRNELINAPYYSVRRPLSARQILEALDRIFSSEDRELDQPSLDPVTDGRGLALVWQRTVDGLLAHLQPPRSVPV